MPDINPSLPIVGQPDSSEEPKVVTALTQLIAAVNNVDTDQIADGAIQAADLQAALLDLLGLSAGGITRRGKAIIPVPETRTNAAYGYMTTADKVTVSLPTDGLLLIDYQATVATTATDAAAALFIDANQVKVAGGNAGAAGPVTQAAPIPSTGGVDRVVRSTSVGLVAVASSGSHADVTTGQIAAASVAGNPSLLVYELGGTTVSFSNTPAAFGGLMVVEAAAGTHDVGVQFKATAGITAKNRRLRVVTLGL